MTKRSITVRLEDGLDARPIAMLVQIASRHESSIHLVAEGKKVNAKSIMGMMSMALSQGETVTIVAEGSDEKEAVEHISDYLSGKAE